MLFAWVCSAWVWIVDHTTVLSAAVSAAAAVASALAAVVVARFTAKLKDATEGQLLVLRESIALARDQLHATHRPEILVYRWEPLTSPDGNRHLVGARFAIVNKGTGNAIIHKVEAALISGDALNAGGFIPTLSVEKVSLASGEAFDYAVFANEELRQELEIWGTPSLDRGVYRRIWCVGRITYADSNSRTRETGFCRVYDFGLCRWAEVANPDYAYAF